MSIHRRKYTKDFKIEMVESALKDAAHWNLPKKRYIPGTYNQVEKQYMEGKFHGTSATDTELIKLKLKICELEQMVGKLTMEAYLLKKEKEFVLQRRKENSSIITGPNSEGLRRDVS